MTRLAVFDLDGTILYRTTAERELFYFLLRKRVIKPSQVVHFLWEAFRLVLSGRTDLLRQNKYYLHRLFVKDIESLLPQFCHYRLKAHFSDRVVKQLHQLKSEGYLIVLLSGAPTIILRQLQRVLPIDLVIGTELEINEGKFTGEITGIYPYGKDKVTALLQRFASTNIDYASSYAFANRYSDIPLLELLGNPVAVHPDRKLRRYACQRNWRILD